MEHKYILKNFSIIYTHMSHTYMIYVYICIMCNLFTYLYIMYTYKAKMYYKLKYNVYYDTSLLNFLSHIKFTIYLLYTIGWIAWKCLIYYSINIPNLFPVFKIETWISFFPFVCAPLYSSEFLTYFSLFPKEHFEKNIKFIEVTLVRLYVSRVDFYDTWSVYFFYFNGFHWLILLIPTIFLFLVRLQ